MLHSTNKNAPRTPEEQQRALEEFLASQEPSTESKSGGKGLVKNVKIGKAFGMPKARRPKKPGLRPQLETSTPEQPPPPITPKPLPPVPIPQGDNNATLPNKPLPPTTGDLIPPKLPEKPPLPTKPLPPVAEKPLLPPSKPEKPNPPPEKPLLPPSKPEKPAKSRLLPPEAAQETSDSHQDIFIRSASKNQPLSPEEQEKAFHEYLASLEKGKQGAPKSPRDNNREESDDKIVIRHTTKNKPLSPEEQAKAFEEYLASLEKEKQEDKTVIIAKTSKNKPLSPEAQQKAMEEFLRQNEQDNSATGLVIKSSSKNRPLTPEEQKIALAEFQARQQLTPQNKNRKNRRISRAFNFSKRMDTTQNIVDEGDNFTPLPKGDEFMKFLIYNHAIVAAGMEAAPRDSQMELAENILEIFSSQETEHKLISSLLQEVINANDTQSTLFRENTPGTQLFSCYCKLKGREYLDNIFAVFFERLMYRKEALEVDPARTSEAAAEKNTKLLFTLVNDVLDKVFNSQSQFPRCLGKLFHKLQELVASKYPDIVAKMSGGFFFLRFFCPMMLAPHLHGMVNHKLSASCNRSIILCTKIIQNLSNNVTFKTEAHMLPFNEIITGRQEECQAFLLSIGNYENLSDQQLNTPENVIQNRLNKSLRFVANMFGSHYWQFADYLAENFHDQLKPLRIILEQIHKIEAIGWVPAEEAGNVQVPPDDFEISRDAFILLREALHQCEAELKETKIRLEEEITLRESMQTVVVQLADSIHSKIDDRVAFKLEQVSQKAREAGIDQRFCNDILSLCTTDSSNTESAEPSKPIPRIVAPPVTEIDMRHTLGGEKKQVLPSHPAPNRGRSRAIGDAPSMEELGVYPNQLPVAATAPDPYTPYEPDY